MKTNNFLTDAYTHTPSLRAVAIGVAFGAGRVLAGNALIRHLSLPNVVTASPASSGTGMLAFLVIKSICVPFFEEALFRKDLKDPSIKEMIENSCTFGLMHALIPGSIETRVARTFTSAIGGLFYCGARVAGADTWSSAIAHSMYNLRFLASS